MSKVLEKSKCTGCMACYNICPNNCIKMVYDEHGELQPEIDKEKCINCGLCRKVCPNNEKIEYEEIKNTYATWSIDEQDRRTSTSGGIASVFYQNAIENGYVAFGMAFDEMLELQCSGEKEYNGINKFKGSKYCQAYIGDNFRKIKKLLNKEEKVIFIGTPCQVSGLNKYLNIGNINKENLITVDLICHRSTFSTIFNRIYK